MSWSPNNQWIEPLGWCRSGHRWLVQVVEVSGIHWAAIPLVSSTAKTIHLLIQIKTKLFNFIRLNRMMIIYGPDSRWPGGATRRRSAVCRRRIRRYRWSMTRRCATSLHSATAPPPPPFDLVFSSLIHKFQSSFIQPAGCKRWTKKTKWPKYRKWKSAANGSKNGRCGEIAIRLSRVCDTQRRWHSPALDTVKIYQKYNQISFVTHSK